MAYKYIGSRHFGGDSEAEDIFVGSVVTSQATLVIGMVLVILERTHEGICTQEPGEGVACEWSIYAL